jgi:acetyl esterase/lipase
MNRADLHPQLRRVFARIPPVPFHNPIMLRAINLIQRLRPHRCPAMPDVAIERHPLRHASVRVYRPKADCCRAALIWLHGGGYTMGDASINDRECVALTRVLGLVVVSVNYRLAPRHPFPAALDDAFEAWRWLLKWAPALNIDPSRIAIAGQSAGGGLAATLVQRIADTDGPRPAAQVLIYPMLDDRTAADAALDQVRHPLWNNRNNRGAWGWYLGRPVGAEPPPPSAAGLDRCGRSGPVPRREPHVCRTPAHQRRSLRPARCRTGAACI